MEVKLRYIYNFRLKKTIFPEDINIKDCIEKRLYKINTLENLEGANIYFINDYIAKFPIIINQQGRIWELGNHYFITYMQNSPNISGNTLESIAGDLFHFYRFTIESKIDLFHFPEFSKLRVIYQYWVYLSRLLRKEKLTSDTANRKIKNVKNFYLACLAHNLISKETIENNGFPLTPDIIKNGDSLLGIKTGLSFRSTNANLQYDEVYDEGRLKPLTLEQQRIFLKFLNKDSNVTFKLMVQLALLTGARKQTIATIKVEDIKKLIEKGPNEQKCIF